MKNLLYILILFVFASCGTTNILVSNSDIEVYVNGQYKGKGGAQIPRMGPPATANIEAKYQSQVVGSVEAKRKFDFLTLFIAIETYGTGAFFAWRYPAEIVVPIDSRLLDNGVRSNKTSGGIWMIPPGGIWNR